MRLVLIIVAAIATLEVAAVADTPPSAESLYAEGQAAYDKADYGAAITKWQASFELSGESGLLFNLAQAKRLAGDCAGAFATYRRFMTADPDQTSEQHKLAADFARELAITCKPPTIPVPIDPQPQPKVDDRLTRHEDHGRAWRIAGIATGAGGAVAIVTGLVLGQHAQGLADEVTAACRTSCDWTVQKDKDAAGRRDATIGRVLDVAGVAAIAGGTVMYYLGVKENLTVTPAPGEHGAVLSWSGSW
jgi:tetratricopeptide (TPR) repeat protein